MAESNQKQVGSEIDLSTKKHFQMLTCCLKI